MRRGGRLAAGHARRPAHRAGDRGAPGARGITVISGMARGIDAAAHLGALDGGGTTLAVLGCGIDVCYPREHHALRDRIAASGCVISEDAGDAPPDTWRFPRRNRLIAALAEAVIVVEGTARSGALSTARWGADLGREILAVPGSIRSPCSEGTNLLIRDGVRPFLCIGDLFEAVPELRRGALVGAPGQLAIALTSAPNTAAPPWGRPATMPSFAGSSTVSGPTRCTPTSWRSP